MDKEKIEIFILYSFMIITITAVFYVSYNYGLSLNTQDEAIAIGQEYLVKDIIIGPNSSVLITYYDNDKNMTEKKLVSTATNRFNIVEVNKTNISIMVLDKIEDHVKYWNVYIHKNDTEVR